jgi:hypothetical protein
MALEPVQVPDAFLDHRGISLHVLGRVPSSAKTIANLVCGKLSERMTQPLGAAALVPASAHSGRIATSAPNREFLLADQPASTNVLFLVPALGKECDSLNSK